MNSKKFPLATVIGYGPDHKTATKLVVSILKKPGQPDPAEMAKWIVQGGDIRQDPSITAAVADFIKSHHAAETVTYDRLLGCPHEEGIDYPVGSVCPQCPFWANVDRHSLEPKSLDLPLTPEQILAGLSIERDTQPLLGFAAVERHRDQMVEPFLQAIERGLDDPKGVPPGDAMLFSYALAFLGKWREPRAYPLVVRWLSLPGQQAYDIGGDTVTEWGSRLLASVCDGNLEPIQQLILNREADEFCRGAAVDALAVLAARGERTVPEVTDYFQWLAREGLEREFNHVWNSLASSCADIEAIPVFAELRRAFDEGLIDPGCIGPEELDDVEAEPRGRQLARFRQHHGPFTDVAKETRWWNRFSQARKTERSKSESELFEDMPPSEYPEAQPYVAPPKTGRNEPCPCGSGKKFKKCCGQ
ncbi:MAG TPA: DUF1186 domain-containing protein [Verrucomicrobiae bacterium]|nr:DUF1186 domain-containing protein [Verrucomicrobiae bacterium]